MKTFLSHHRAAIALVGFVALAADLVWHVPDEASGLVVVGEWTLIAFVVLGGVAIFEWFEPSGISPTPVEEED